jgi:hypothetical protein
MSNVIALRGNYSLGQVSLSFQPKHLIPLEKTKLFFRATSFFDVIGAFSKRFQSRETDHSR